MVRYMFSFVLVVLLMAGLNVGVASAQLPDTIDLDQGQEDVRIPGGELNVSYKPYWSGRAVASGDINGDGVDDLIIGAPSPIPSVTYIIYGSDSLPDTVDLAWSQEDVRILGWDHSGSAVACGDVNGDGYDDLIIGAPMANPPGGVWAGKTYIIFGSGSLSATINLNLGQEDVVILGDDADDRSGCAVACGDVNGDRYDDLIIGALFADPPGVDHLPSASLGETYIIYGWASLPDTIDLAASQEDVRILGDDSGDRSGTAVASGDINGDGHDDIIIGSPYAGAFDAGITYLVYGSTSLPATIDLDLGQEDVRIRGHDVTGYSGNAVASGDINGDSVDDLIIGAYCAAPPGMANTGETYIIYGSASLPATVDLFEINGEEDVRILGDDHADESGYAVASGDINGDGYDDVIIGAWKADPPGGLEAGETYIIYGSASLPDTVDLARGEEDVRILGDDEDDRSSWAVACGDINGDGGDDIIIGAPYADADRPGGTWAGETYVIYGYKSKPLPVPFLPAIVGIIFVILIGISVTIYLRRKRSTATT